MRKIDVLGIFLILFLIVAITNISSTISVSTYEIKSSGEYLVPTGTYVRTTSFYCKSFIDKTKNESRVYHNNTELIKMPDYASNYLFKVSLKENKSEALCEIYEYSRPYFDMTCISTHLNSNDTTKCDLYVTTSNYGLDSIKLRKNNDDIKITDFDSTNFNMNSYNNEFSFIPKNDLNLKTKYLVGTITLFNTSSSDGKVNILTLDNIYVNDSVSSFKVENIEHSFKEDVGNNEDIQTSTTKMIMPSPKTDIEYTSNNKNTSSKTKLRAIVILLIIVVVASINLGIVIVFLFSNKKK